MTTPATPDIPVAWQTAAAPVFHVSGERHKIAAGAPNKWIGTALPMSQWGGPGKGTPVPGAVDVASIRIEHRGKPLTLGKEVLADLRYGTLGLPPGSPLTPEDEVTIAYSYSHRRLDSVVRLADGGIVVRQGEASLVVVKPPPLHPGETRLANLLVDHFSTGSNLDVYPLAPGLAPAVTRTTPGRLPRTMAKLAAGGPVSVVCWGDSVTAGGDASSPERRYPDVFEAMLRQRFPRAAVAVHNVSVGGSWSRHWLYPDKMPFPDPVHRPECNWQRIVDARPDLVTVEFVNDSNLDEGQVRDVYGEILARVRALGAELILITPHFTVPHLMKIESLRGAECRPYVHALCRFAEEHGLALADASSRWGNLWREGLPYTTLLQNGINHPDDRGHQIFADELMGCFAERES